MRYSNFLITAFLAIASTAMAGPNPIIEARGEAGALSCCCGIGPRSLASTQVCVSENAPSTQRRDGHVLVLI